VNFLLVAIGADFDNEALGVLVAHKRNNWALLLS
jgi:hypothetical protein